MTKISRFYPNITLTHGIIGEWIMQKYWTRKIIWPMLFLFVRLSADLPQEVTFFFYIFVLKLVTLCEIFLDEFGQIGS